MVFNKEEHNELFAHRGNSPQRHFSNLDCRHCIFGCFVGFRTRTEIPRSGELLRKRAETLYVSALFH